jgi:hypothetical protein
VTHLLQAIDSFTCIAAIPTKGDKHQRDTFAGVGLYKLLTEGSDDDFNDTVNSFVGIAAIQVNLSIACSKCVTLMLISLCRNSSNTGEAVNSL